MRIDLDRVHAWLVLWVEPLVFGAAVRALALTRTLRGRTSPSEAVIVAGPGRGSVGDEAMLAAAVAQFDGPTHLVVRSESDLIQPERFKDSILASLPSLLYGRVFSGLRDTLLLADLASRSEHTVVIGADVMDGKYDLRSSIRRFHVLRYAARVGSRPRILGFSWREEPDPLARQAMETASRSATLCARDVASGARLVRDGATEVRHVADLAFLTSEEPMPEGALTEFVQHHAEADREIVIVNANFHLIGPFPDLVDGLVNAIGSLGDNYAYVFLPHDTRGEPSDADLLREVVARASIPAANAFMVDGVLDGGAEVALARRASFAISGRMHLAIIAAVGGCPTLMLSYQGKVAGLYEMLGVNCWIREGAPLDAAFVASAHDLARNAGPMRSQLESVIPSMQELARRNFD